MIGAGFCQSSHAVLYSFGTLTWRGAGIDDVTISMLWGESVAVEILLMMASGWLMKRIGVIGLIAPWPRLRHRALDRAWPSRPNCRRWSSAADAARRHLRRLPPGRHGLHPARAAGDGVALGQSIYYALGTGATQAVIFQFAGVLYARDTASMPSSAWRRSAWSGLP